MRILQVGLGNFGRRHFEAWHRLGMSDSLWVAAADRDKWEHARRYNFPADRLVTGVDELLERVDVVDVVTPTESHFELCKRALLAGRDVFVEKPMTMTAAESRELAVLVDASEASLSDGRQL